MIAAIALTVRPWFTETRRAADARTDLSGAATLLNRNTIILTALSVLGGLVLYGFTGMYPTFLREGLHYSPKQAGWLPVYMERGLFFRLPAVARDRFSPRIVLSAAFFATAGLGYLCFHGTGAIVPQAILTLLTARLAAHDLRQSGRLSCEGGAKQVGQPGVGNVRDEPIRHRCGRRLSDGGIASHAGGQWRERFRFRSSGLSPEAGVGSAARSNGTIAA